ncbi:VOC family protein [Castellaniella sp.]|uniref:VOC family protein n=1 Tax=Castellaniella sp. TaxID=1955812 RepID=UPI002AFE5145|nr:VOC family protein [Castellaniella sp.]
MHAIPLIRRVFLLKAWGMYRRGGRFVDPIQGVAGCFLIGAGPRIELLENIEGFETLTPWLDAGVSMYHLAYLVERLEEGIAWARRRRGKLLVSPAPAVAFKERLVCFAMLPGGFSLLSLLRGWIEGPYFLNTKELVYV